MDSKEGKMKVSFWKVPQVHFFWGGGGGIGDSSEHINEGKGEV